jgi:GR25 family glycosyltransferase involved in LPS biosynthesis
MKIDKTYIVHYEPLVNRRAYIDSIINNISDNFEFILSNPETDEKLRENLDYHYKHDPSVLTRVIPINELAVSVSHLRIYDDMLQNGYQLCLIIEDDAILKENFNESLTEILQEDIGHFDFIFLSTCCDIKIEKTNNLHIQNSPISKCVSGYLVNSKKLKEVIAESRPISTNIDNHLNDIKHKLGLEFGSCEPPIIIQGSETHYGSNFFR